MQNIQPDLLHHPMLWIRLSAFYFSAFVDNLEYHVLYELY